MGKLTATKLRTLVQPGTYGDGEGLYLQVRGPRNRSWLFRYKLNRKPRLMGLGRAADLTLAEAREAAQAARRLVRQGIDPIDRRRAERASTGLNTFREVAEAYIRAHSPGWRNAQHREQWQRTLESYAYPILGSLGVATIDTGAIMRVLEPIWRGKTETAGRLRGRIEAVLDYASANGWRTGDNPARLRGHLSKLLPARSKIAPVKHHPALPWQQIRTFMRDLQQQQSVSALALRFTILTAARTGEVIGARWSEIDATGKVWCIPGARMKSGRDHRVPLSDDALDVLREMEKLRTEDSDKAPVFPGSKRGIPLSNMAMLMLLRRMRKGRLTVHGFRSTFRDWCAETTNYPREVAEAALAHTLNDKTEAAYQRADLIEKRRRLMTDWSGFCASSAVERINGIPLHQAAD
jgi:integrase